MTRRLNALEPYTGKIACLPGVGLRGARVVDGVVLPRVEGRNGCRDLRFRKPAHARVEVPGRFRFQVWIAQRRRIAVVQIEVGRDAKTVANRGVNGCFLGKPPRSGDHRTEHGAAAIEDLFARSKRKRAPCRFQPLNGRIACAAISAVLSKVRAVDLVRIFFQAAGKRQILCEDSLIANRAFKAVIDVLIFISPGSSRSST